MSTQRQVHNRWRCIYIYIYIYIYTHTHTCTYIHTYVRIHIHTHTYCWRLQPLRHMHTISALIWSVVISSNIKREVAGSIHTSILTTLVKIEVFWPHWSKLRYFDHIGQNGGILTTLVKIEVFWPRWSKLRYFDHVGQNWGILTTLRRKRCLQHRKKTTKGEVKFLLTCFRWRLRRRHHNTITHTH
jgi:hypothetical protein